MKEANMVSTLRHPNIVQFLGASIEPPHLYIITELCHRGNLAHILRDRKTQLTLEKQISFCIDTCQGMQYLHSNKPPIIHRGNSSTQSSYPLDLKTQNLLVDKNWTVKVGDFNISRFADSQRTMTSTTTPYDSNVLSDWNDSYLCS